jgi:NAD(P)-dependent dehydrogenase (short-subunit alcohol dehydrogenase family)
MSAGFEKLTVVVTGAGAGIGRALAAGFARDGAQVVGFGRNLAALEETRDRFGQGRMHVVAGDVAVEADVVRLFEEAKARTGKVDVLVNNAAIYPREPFLGGGTGSFERTFAVNVIGMARCCRLSLPGMLERNFGRIVNLGSFAWKAPIANASAYSISKAAVHALTRAVAAEIDRDTHPNVLVNELCPGAVRTSMSAEGRAPEDVYPETRQLVELGSGGPSGKTYEDGQMVVENQGLRARLGRIMRFGG